MTESVKDSVSANAAALLIHYSFDLNGYTADELVTAWAATYQPLWVRSAVIEALYQGRYKAISVEQILALWLRRGQPLYHFNHEFERIVCSKFPQLLVPKVSAEAAIAVLPPPKFPPQSHWRYLLPGTTATDNIPTAPETGSAFSFSASVGFESELSMTATNDEARIAEYLKEAHYSEEHLREQPPTQEFREERSQPECQPESRTESQPSTPSLEPNPTPDAIVVDPTPAATPQPPEVSAELPGASLPILPQTSPVTPSLPSAESGMATDVSLESVLAEADRLLENLGQCDRDSSSVEPALGNQAKPEPIHQFVPLTESSEFYSKLKAVAQSPEDSVTVSESFSSSESNSRRA
ncbi:MAG TPA: hypothetical protein V6C63_16550 [Allocoleopsis sp.]